MSYGHLSAQQAFYMREQEPLTFVLVHGSWTDASFWDGIAYELRRLGHLVYAPTLLGHGQGVNKQVNHAQITKSLVDFIRSNHLSNIVLVGHSFGGSVVQKAAEQIPSLIRRLVFWNAFVLNDGESLADQFPVSVQQFLLGLAEQSADRTVLLPFPFFRDTFANLADLPLAQRLYRGISAEPSAPFVERLDLKTFFKLTIPKSYINLQEDIAVPPSAKYGWHPHMSSRLGVYRLIQGHGDHFSTAAANPGGVAGLIVQAGRD